jgi:(p)ppGpp synthase/HD superfamily hydrolase
MVGRSLLSFCATVYLENVLVLVYTESWLYKVGKQMNLIHEAIIFATCKHDGYKRKGTDIPYISHPMEVMQILTEARCRENVIIAGILHDILEDTKTSPLEILNLFGEEVLNLVLEESEDKSKPWKERKQETIDSLANASPDAKMVCFADKLSNLRSMAADKREIGEKLWERFNAGKDDIEWYYCQIGKMAFHPWDKEYDSLLAEVFG